MNINCIAVDDEILALNKIKRFVSKIGFIELQKTFDNAKDAIKYLQENNIDLIFLDIEMPEINGFQFIQKLIHKPYIILTTAFDQYALKSYDFEVHDYLLKPIQFDRFLKSVEKVYSAITKDAKLDLLKKESEAEAEKEHFYVKSSGKLVKVYFDDILYIEGMKDYLSVHTKHARILTLMNFGQIISKLPENDFLRVHKSYLISKNKIDKFDSSEIIIQGTIIPLSKTYKNEFLKLMKKVI